MFILIRLFVIMYHNLNTESSLVAFRWAINQINNKDLVLIHHSDRGLQYCAN